MPDQNNEQPDDFLLNAAADSSSEDPDPTDKPPVEPEPDPKNSDPDPNLDPDPNPDPVEPEPGADPNPEPDPDPTDSFSFKEHFSDYENVDSVKQLVSRGASFTQEIETELNKFRANKEQFETDQAALKELQGQSPYKDNRYYKLEKLSEESPDLVPVYQKLMFGNPDPLEIIKQDLILKHPEIFKDDPESLNRRVQVKYPALFDSEVEKDSDEYKNAYTDMQMDSKIIKGELMKKIDSIDVPDPKVANIAAEEKQKEFIKSWNPFSEKLKKSLVNVSVEIKDEKGVIREKAIIDIPIPEKEQSNYLNKAAHYILQNNLEASEESLVKVTNFAQALWIADNRIQYNTLIAAEMAAESSKELREKINNPKKEFSTSKQPNPTKKDGDDEAMEKMRERDNEI